MQYACTGLDSTKVTNLDVSTGTDANGTPYAEIAMTYVTDLDFVFFTVDGITMNATRRVFVQL